MPHQRSNTVLKSSYILEFPKRKDFPMNEIREWLSNLPNNSVSYRNQKRKVIYEFQNLDDAFKFRLFFGDHLDR